tara:strand:+ start:410 stop:757 length:348 start_codon:yes stop_codon:yes gene_type:complete
MPESPVQEWTPVSYYRPPYTSPNPTIACTPGQWTEATPERSPAVLVAETPASTMSVDAAPFYPQLSSHGRATVVTTAVAATTTTAAEAAENLKSVAEAQAAAETMMAMVAMDMDR